MLSAATEVQRVTNPLAAQTESLCSDRQKLASQIFPVGVKEFA